MMNRTKVRVLVATATRSRNDMVNLSRAALTAVVAHTTVHAKDACSSTLPTTWQGGDSTGGHGQGAFERETPGFMSRNHAPWREGRKAPSGCLTRTARPDVALTDSSRPMFTLTTRAQGISAVTTTHHGHGR